MKTATKVALSIGGGVAALGLGYYIFKRFVPWRSTDSSGKTTSWQGCGEYPGDIPSYSRFNCGDKVLENSGSGHGTSVGEVTQQVWDGRTWWYYTSRSSGKIAEQDLSPDDGTGLFGARGVQILGGR